LRLEDFPVGYLILAVVIVAIGVALAPYILPVVGWGLLALGLLLVAVLVPLFALHYVLTAGDWLWVKVSPVLPKHWRRKVTAGPSVTPSP
jgi:hypothetical protein